jgi:glycosyltransferase involved in cell wall biosynthesis
MSELSIVVCTYKRYDLARNCLAFLREQTLERSRFEIVVVDNTPIALREEQDWKALGADVAVVEDEPGLSRARNKGIASSSGALIAFIDDDAEAAPQWAAETIAMFARHPKVRVVGGRVTAKYVERPRPRWMSARLEGYLSCIDWGPDAAPLERGQWIVGANMIYRRDVFTDFGDFNPSLGRIGHGTLLSNEESQLLSRLAPGEVWYAGQIPVDHLIPAERVVQPWFRKRVFWQAVSDQLAGLGSSDTVDAHFERFASALPRVPAQDRSFRALHRVCVTAEDFESQLQMLYSLCMAEGLGLPNTDSAHALF